MKSITSLRALNLKPTIVVSHEALQAIKHIVSIAPEEAQWFHTVNPIQYKNLPGQVFLHLSTKLYIPKQNTSAAQVDSSSTMMIEFYKELVEEYTDQEIVNQKLNSMTCWCHSHHNMTPTPSTQDNSQFNFFVNSSIDQNQQNWQIMLIFNKKDQFYSRVYDPNTGLIMEGVDIVTEANYDFTYIDKAAKDKFLKPKLKINYKKTKTSKNSSINDFQDWWFQRNNPTNIIDLNEEMADSLVDELFSTYYPDSANNYLQKVASKRIDPVSLYKDLITNLDDQEALWLSFILDDTPEKVSNFYSAAQADAYMAKHASKIDERCLNYLTNTSDTLGCLVEKISFLYSLTDATSKADFLKTVRKYT